jgi:probable phosphoglycerate mutase
MLAEAQLRIINGISKLIGEFSGKTVVVVSHADMIKSALCFYLGLHIDHMHRFEISPCSVSMMELFEDTARVTLMNHLGDIKL